jgi:hypothetical protein
MKTLAKQFTKKGFIHKQIKREGNIAIYERARIGSGIKHFEVIVIASHDGYEIGGAKIEASEVYPSSASWGASGWTFVDFDIAEAKMDRLVKQQQPIQRIK